MRAQRIKRSSFGTTRAEKLDFIKDLIPVPSDLSDESKSFTIRDPRGKGAPIGVLFITSMLYVNKACQEAVDNAAQHPANKTTTA